MLFVWVEALRPSQQFFSHVRTFSSVELVLSNEDDVSCLRTQHRSLVRFDLLECDRTQELVFLGSVVVNYGMYKED